VAGATSKDLVSILVVAQLALQYVFGYSLACLSFRSPGWNTVYVEASENSKMSSEYLVSFIM